MKAPNNFSQNNLTVLAAMLAIYSTYDFITLACERRNLCHYNLIVLIVFVAVVISKMHQEQHNTIVGSVQFSSIWMQRGKQLPHERLSISFCTHKQQYQMQKGRKTQRNLMNIRSVALICNTDMFLHILCIFLVRALSLSSTSLDSLFFSLSVSYYFHHLLLYDCSHSSLAR